MWGRRDETRTDAAATGVRVAAGVVEVDGLTCVEVEVLTGAEVDGEPACVKFEELFPDALGHPSGCTEVEPPLVCGGASGFGSACARCAASAMTIRAQPKTKTRLTIIPLALTTRASPSLVGDFRS
jgi:hypothetical protein